MKRIPILLAVLCLLTACCALASAEEGTLTPYSYLAEAAVPQISITTEGGIAIDDSSLINPDEHKGMGGTLPAYNYVNATITVSNCEGWELENVAAQVKVRGNYTSAYPKRPIRIKFSEKQAMCGLNDGAKLKSWVLLAEYKDPSLLRNATAWTLAKSLYSTTNAYASDFRLVEVYLNGEYNGVYMLSEQQQVNKHRVNVPEPVDENDVKTGYFIEFDGYYTESPELERFVIHYDELTHADGSTFNVLVEGDSDGTAAFSDMLENVDTSALTEMMNEFAASFGGGSETEEGGDGETAENAFADFAASFGGSSEAQEGGDGETTENAFTDFAASFGGSSNGQAEQADSPEASGANPSAPDAAEGSEAEPAADNANSFGGSNGNNADGDNGFGASNGGQGGFNFGDFFGEDGFDLAAIRGVGFTIKSDIDSEAQRDFIQQCVQTIWDVLYDACYGDHADLTENPYHTMDADGNYVADETILTAQEAVACVVDIDSLVDMYIIQEICQDGDIAWSSFFFSLDMSAEGNHLLTYTAPWDFDSGLGTNMGNASTNTLYAMNTDNPWLVVYAHQDWFWQAVTVRWQQAEQAGIFTRVEEMIDTYATLYAEAYARNNDRWHTLGTRVEISQVQQALTFRTQADAAAYLKNWFHQRVTDLGTLLMQQASP